MSLSLIICSTAASIWDAAGKSALEALVFTRNCSQVWPGDVTRAAFFPLCPHPAAEFSMSTVL